MTLYTVEVTTAPVTDDNWTVLESALDTVPGTILLRDAEMPALLFPVEEENPMRAAMFVDGVSRLIGFTITACEIYETPCHDGDDDEAAPATAVVQAVSEWMDSVPPVERHLAADGTLERV